MVPLFFQYDKGWRAMKQFLSPPVKVFFTDRSKAVLLLWIVFVASCWCVLCCKVCSL